MRALFKNITPFKPEYPLESRAWTFIWSAARRIFIEVKGCTLERDGIGYFRCTDGARGKHLYELAEAARGYECYIAFVIAMPGVRRVLPNVAMDPEFAQLCFNHDSGCKGASPSLLCLAG